MTSQMNSTSKFPIFLSKLSPKTPPSSTPKLHFITSSNVQSKQEPSSSSVTAKTTSNQLKVKFQTLETCKLGISSYPYFQYNATGGMGTGTGSKQPTSDDIQLFFDTNTLYIPPLQSSTTRFLGLPLPPFLKIAILPQLLQGTLNKQTGKVELQFKAEFCFSVGSIYKAPPLFVETTLTTEELKGEMQSGRGARLDGEGNCRLVGVAIVEPVNDVFMNSFLGLPTECIAVLNASISIS